VLRGLEFPAGGEGRPMRGGGISFVVYCQASPVEKPVSDRSIKPACEMPDETSAHACCISPAILTPMAFIMQRSSVRVDVRDDRCLLETYEVSPGDGCQAKFPASILYQWHAVAVGHQQGDCGEIKLQSPVIVIVIRILEPIRLRSATRIGTEFDLEFVIAVDAPAKGRASAVKVVALA